MEISQLQGGSPQERAEITKTIKVNEKLVRKFLDTFSLPVKVLIFISKL